MSGPQRSHWLELTPEQFFQDFASGTDWEKPYDRTQYFMIRPYIIENDKMCLFAINGKDYNAPRHIIQRENWKQRSLKDEMLNFWRPHIQSGELQGLQFLDLIGRSDTNSSGALRFHDGNKEMGKPYIDLPILLSVSQCTLQLPSIICGVNYTAMVKSDWARLRTEWDGALVYEEKCAMRKFHDTYLNGPGKPKDKCLVPIPDALPYLLVVRETKTNTSITRWMMLMDEEDFGRGALLMAFGPNQLPGDIWALTHCRLRPAAATDSRGDSQVFRIAGRSTPDRLEPRFDKSDGVQRGMKGDWGRLKVRWLESDPGVRLVDVNAGDVQAGKVKLAASGQRLVGSPS